VTCESHSSYPMHRRSSPSAAKNLCGGVTVLIDVAIGLAGFSCMFGTTQPFLTVGMSATSRTEPNAGSIHRVAIHWALSAQFLR
jgi:hypothetical protein